MLNLRRALTGAAGVTLSLGLFAAAPSAQAACGDYGQPPCPTPTATPTPPPTPTRTPTPTPSKTPPDDVTNPQNATIVGGGIIVVSEAVAEEVRVEPRLILQPMGVSQGTGQTVEITRFAAHAVVAQFLKPDRVYLTQIKVKGKWQDLGKTEANGIGQLPIPVFRATLLGTFPLRVVEQGNGRQTRYMTLVVKPKPKPTPVSTKKPTPTPTPTKKR